MRLTDVSSAALAAVLITATGRLVAQSGGSSVRKVVDVDIGFTYGLAEPSSGRFIAYANPQGIHVLDPRTGKTTATIDRTTAAIPTAYFGGGLSISASGRRLVFVATGESNTRYAWSVDLDSMTGKPVSAPHRVSIMPADVVRISDDGRWLTLVTSAASRTGAPAMRRLLVMPSDGGDERMLDSAARIQTPYWTPDGKAIYYIRGRGRGPALMRVAAAGGKPDSLAPGVAVIGVSADGKRIAYYPPTNGDRSPLRIADLQGRSIGMVPTGVTDLFLTWSRSDPATLLGKRAEWRSSFKMVSLDDGKVSPYPLADHHASDPRFSPNGRQLAARTMVDDRMQIVVFEVASKRRRVLATTAEPDGASLQWSPDGSRIAFLALDSTLMRHDLYLVDVATSRATRLADLGPAKLSNATLFRWRSDGRSIDYITGTTPRGTAASLERVTLTGAHSVVRKLPAASQGQGGTTGGYRLLDDSLVAIARDYTETPGDSSYLVIVDTRTGTTRAFINRFAYWQLFASPQGELSPDGKWLAFGSGGLKDNRPVPQWAITSLDGKTVRLLGEPMGCDAWPVAWLPDSRGLIAVGAQSCDAFTPEVYVVPIDGSPARRLSVPENGGTTVTPDGRSLIVAADDGGPWSIVALDITKALTERASQAGKPRTSGKN